MRAAHPDGARQCIELFSGCGGLALGIARAGFEHRLLVEWNAHACATLNANATNGNGVAATTAHAADRAAHADRQDGASAIDARWLVARGDVRAIDWTAARDSLSGVASAASLAGGASLTDPGLADLDLIAGGPPCQPFSSAGLGRAHDDPRDMWPEAIRSVRELAPRAFLFENVQGFLRPRFAPYLSWIIESLRRPLCARRPGETHAEHLARLARSRSALRYDVGVFAVNAADFGAAQQRRRVVVAGIRREPGAPERLLAAPTPTHSREALLWDQWIAGDYWRRHAIRAPKTGPADARDAAWVAAQRIRGIEPQLRPAVIPWRTTRDAIAGLGEPNGQNQHVFQAGAKVYANHTGSALDLPAKALKAGAHGVPGGENMLIGDDGTPRYFSVREAARLQGFHDAWQFEGPRSEGMRQLGNAVPVQLSEALGRWIAGALEQRA
ncbi:DNA cytosine methyltransferase [Burkholderia vietnamiensis]|nr:DNA cytosine methyltransferase [Burkholderia vietnamiensis]